MPKKTKRLTKAARQIQEIRIRTERHLRMPIEDWRLKKRQQWRAVVTALEQFNYGSAYTPVGNDLYELQRAAQRISDTLAEDWVPY